MKNLIQSTESRILFWAAIGPTMLVATLFVGIVQGTANLYLPFAALLGIPICWQYKMRGLMATLTLVGACLLIGYGDVSAGERFWQVGMAMALALSLVVCALSFEEVEHLVQRLEQELQSRLEGVWRLDEKLKNMQERWQYDRQDYSVRIKLLNQELEDARQHQQAQERGTEHAATELQQMEEERKRILAELLHEQQTNAQLKLQIQESQAEVRGLAQEPVAPPDVRRLEGQLRQLRDQFDEKNEVLHQTRKELYETNEHLLAAQRQREEENRSDLRDVEKNLQKLLDKTELQRQEKEREVDELHGLVSSLYSQLESSPTP